MNEYGGILEDKLHQEGPENLVFSEKVTSLDKSS